VKPRKAKTLTLARKLAAISIEGGEPSSERVDAVLAYLSKRPMAERKAVLKVYLRMMRREEYQRTLLIEHAGALDDTSRAGLVGGMGRGRKLMVTDKDNPALLGGLRVRLGDDVYDASLQGILDRFGTR
jgi:F-type H+-transporting ATPase subunit delta